MVWIVSRSKSLALLWTIIGLIVAVTVIGVWTSIVMEQYWGPDPRAIVTDEYVGTWIPLLAAPCGEYIYCSLPSLVLRSFVLL